MGYPSPMAPIPLFVELCAGLVSVSGALQHGLQWKPPISRMGRKTGYAEAILRVMGLRPRQGAAHYLWAEADSDVAALLAAYTQPEMMRQIADIIRSWIPCPYGPHEGWCSRCKGTGRWDARDLWETLRREKRRGLWEGFDPAAVGRFAVLGSWSYRQGDEDSGGFVGPGDRRQDTSALALALALDRAALPFPPVTIAQSAHISPEQTAAHIAIAGLTNPRVALGSVDGQFVNLEPGGFTFNGHPDWIVERETAIGRVERAVRTWPPVLLAQSAGVEPGEVAGWSMSQAWAAHGKDLQSYGGPGREGGSETERAGVAARFSCPVWPPVHLTPDAAIQPPQIPLGTVVYFDPPYAGTTGYKHDLPRAEVIQIALRWHEAGARVYISEAEPLPIPGWHHVEIGSERRGQKRTFSAQQREILTCSHPPAWTPPQQAKLF